ncbi:hypothetical protein ACQ9BO_24225 [Flavobacterium sp. P21]|uniref:hypothetical protein n=1 Tax=Flavobacterium sp. P21 TaxID=3423948 RepID=UPI003D66FD64
MTANDILEKLKAIGDPKVFAQNKKRGASENQFGVKMGDIRTLAKKSKPIMNWLWNFGKLEMLTHVF